MQLTTQPHDLPPVPATRSTPRILFRTTHAQVFTIDLIIGLVIMTLAIIGLTLYTTSKPAPLRADAEGVSVLMSEGAPSDWNLTNVTTPGFLTNGRLNTSKVSLFESLTYVEQQRLLAIRSDFRIRFRNATDTFSLCSTCGTEPPQDTSDILPIRRYVFYNGTLATMDVLVWR